MNRSFRSTTLVAWLLVVAILLAACGGGAGGRGGMTNYKSAPVLTSDAALGQRVYASTCIHCHGENAIGLPNLGKDLTTSEFIAGQTDKALIDFIKRGRSSDDPANSTGMPMPPKGGNPGLSDHDLADVVTYLRSLQQR